MGQRIIFIDPENFDTKLEAIKQGVNDPGAVYTRLNCFPPAVGADRDETGITFGDGETVCVIDQGLSKIDQGYWVATVTQTSNGRIYSNVKS